MKFYQVTISLGGPKRRVITGWLVSLAEAEDIRDTTHPVLEPEIITHEVAA